MPDGDFDAFLDAAVAATRGGREAGGDMLLNRHARAVLAPLLAPNGRYLPVLRDERDCQGFERQTAADIADQDRIEGVRRKEIPTERLDRWRNITRRAFTPERVAVAPAIFTVPQRRSTIMCTDVLRDAVTAHDLPGFSFELPWSPEGGGVELDISPAQFFGKSGRRMNIAGKERCKPMLAILQARAKADAASRQS